MTVHMMVCKIALEVLIAARSSLSIVHGLKNGATLGDRDKAISTSINHRIIILNKRITH